MSPFTLWRWSFGSWGQNRVVSDNDANASEGTGRYPRVFTGFKKTYSDVDVSNRGTVEDMLLQKQSLFCYWPSWRELTQCSEEYRKQAVALHQLILFYRFSISQSLTHHFGKALVQYALQVFDGSPPLVQRQLTSTGPSHAALLWRIQKVQRPY